MTKKRTMSPEEMLAVWEEKIASNVCDKCGGSNCLIQEENNSILHCITCGYRFYKFYPSRSYRYDLCLTCGCFYVTPYDKPNRGICNVCIKLNNDKKHHISRIRLKVKSRLRLTVRRIRLDNLSLNKLK
jgi:hypothetical protein